MIRAVRERLRKAKQSEIGIDLDIFKHPQNPYFLDLADQDPLSQKPEYIFPGSYTNHTDERGSRLLDRCRQHRARFEHDKDTEGVIVVVHPFYVFFQNRQKTWNTKTMELQQKDIYRTYVLLFQIETGEDGDWFSWKCLNTMQC